MKGLITYTVLENQGSIHEVDVKMTEEGLKYADKTDDNVYIVTLYTCKVGEILEKEFMEEYGKGNVVILLYMTKLLLLEKF